MIAISNGNHLQSTAISFILKETEQRQDHRGVAQNIYVLQPRQSRNAENKMAVVSEESKNMKDVIPRTISQRNHVSSLYDPQKTYLN